MLAGGRHCLGLPETVTPCPLAECALWVDVAWVRRCVSPGTWWADIVLAGGVWLGAGVLGGRHVCWVWVCVFSSEQLVYVAVCLSRHGFPGPW